MSEENVEALREAFERFGRGDFSGNAELPDEVEVVTGRDMPDAGTYRGEAAQKWLEAWVDSFDSLTLELIETLDAGDKVIAEFVQRGTPRGGSTSVELRTWSVNTGRGGNFTRFELFTRRDEALQAAGLSE
jgi:ketosteroid isomerase-like protein